MSFAPLIDQRPLVPQGAEDCGEASLGMCLGNLGHGVNMAAILNDHNGVTDISTLLNMCSTFGLKGCYEISGGFDNNDKLVIALIHDNAYADPAAGGPYEHYIVIYAQDAGNVYAANPWGGDLKTYPLSEFNPAYIAGIVIPRSANTVGAPAPAPAPKPGGSTVASNLSASEAVALELMADLIMLGRELGQPDLDAAAGELSSGDLQTRVQWLESVPEAKNRKGVLDWLVSNLTDGNGGVAPARLVAALGIAAAAQGPKGDKGDPGPVGPQGPQGIPGVSGTGASAPAPVPAPPAPSPTSIAPNWFQTWFSWGGKLLPEFETALGLASAAIPAVVSFSGNLPPTEATALSSFALAALGVVKGLQKVFGVSS